MFMLWFDFSSFLEKTTILLFDRNIHIKHYGTIFMSILWPDNFLQGKLPPPLVWVRVSLGWGIVFLGGNCPRTSLNVIKNKSKNTLNVNISCNRQPFEYSRALNMPWFMNISGLWIYLPSQKNRPRFNRDKPSKLISK